jgi:hypothetical protein
MKWFELNPQRFEIEKCLLAQYHPGSKLIKKHGKLKVTKHLITDLDTYIIEGVFSDRHPYLPMDVYIREPPLEGSPPHRYSTEHICIHGPGDVGPETTAKVYLDWAVQWINTYERWLNGEPWPETNQD